LEDVREEKSRRKFGKRAVSTSSLLLQQLRQEDAVGGFFWWLRRNSNKIFIVMVLSDLESMHTSIFPGSCFPHRDTPSFCFFLFLSAVVQSVGLPSLPFKIVWNFHSTSLTNVIFFSFAMVFLDT